MEIPTQHDIWLFRVPSSCFLLQRMLSHCSLISFFVCRTYAVTLLELCLFETGKDSSWVDCTADCCFFTAGFVVSFIVWLSFFSCSCLEAPLCTKFCFTVKHVFYRELTCLTQLFKNKSIFFYHAPPIFLESEGICFCAPTSQIPTFFENGEDVFCNYLHAMGGICKEGYIWDSLINFSFGWIQNLTSGTFGWIIEHS